MIQNRYDALMLLGVSDSASEEEIKKQYKALCKRYHPDQNKDPYANSFYIQVQEAYQFLRDHPATETDGNPVSYSGVRVFGYGINGRSMYGNHSNNFGMNYGAYPYQYPYGYSGVNASANQMNQRPAKIFSTDKAAEKLHQRQVAYAEDKKRIENGLKEKAAGETEQSVNVQKNQEEDTLKAIRAIWLAEQIHRKIEQDKLEKEREQKRNLLKAFSQHDILEKEEIGEPDLNTKTDIEE